MHVPAPHCTRTAFSALFICLLCASTVLLSAQTQPAPKPFTKADVITLLAGNVSAKRVEGLARERGIDFQITPETESEFRKAGATDPLLATLRDLAPKPPTLVVTTNPGGAQVFVDDELIARTSAEGRLRISRLTAGSHKLRVSLDGYPDHEENLDLVAGETLAVSVHLERNTQRTPPAASSGGPGATGANSAPGSAAGNALTLPGNIGCSNIFPSSTSTYSGRITVGNGRLRFSANYSSAKHSFDVPLSSVVPRNQSRSAVEFDVQFSDKKQHCGFWVYLGKQREDDNVVAARELFEALKIGSK